MIQAFFEKSKWCLHCYELHAFAQYPRHHDTTFTHNQKQAVKHDGVPHDANIGCDLKRVVCTKIYSIHCSASTAAAALFRYMLLLTIYSSYIGIGLTKYSYRLLVNPTLLNKTKTCFIDCARFLWRLLCIGKCNSPGGRLVEIHCVMRCPYHLPMPKILPKGLLDYMTDIVHKMPWCASTTSGSRWILLPFQLSFGTSLRRFNQGIETF